MQLPVLFFAVLACSLSIMAQNVPCDFDEKTLMFIGTPIEQARCLLRPNKIGGVLGEPLAKLPDPLEKLIGTSSAPTREKLRGYIAKNKIDETVIGGSLDLKLASGIRPDGAPVSATYFVIHDTSTPNLMDEPFPMDFDSDAGWKWNNLDMWIKTPVAHVFVNRLGDSITTTPFDQPVAKGFGTKFARDFLKADAKGMQIHIELVQPRRRDPAAANTNNDRFAPVPGFSQKQYERLALLYVAASVRGSKWLIPAYHSAIDAGIKDAHDDPQNFELTKFAAELKRLVAALG